MDNGNITMMMVQKDYKFTPFYLKKKKKTSITIGEENVVHFILVIRLPHVLFAPHDCPCKWQNDLHDNEKQSEWAQVIQN